MDPADLKFIQSGVHLINGVDMTKLPDGGLPPALFDPDAVFDLGQMALPDEAAWHGRDGIAKGWQRWLAQWDDYRLTMTNLEPYGDDRVVMDVHAEARGRGSGAPISIDHAQVWTFRNRRILRIDVHADRADALEALSREARDGAGAPRTPPAP